MAANTIVVEVRKALVAAIETKLAEPRVSVTYGWQGGDVSARREQVFTNRPRATHDPAGLRPGRGFRDETVDLDIVVLVSAPNAKTEDCDDRAFEIGRAVENIVADNKGNQLGIDGLNWLRMTGFELNNMAGAGGSLSEITYTVRYNARLT